MKTTIYTNVFNGQTRALNAGSDLVAPWRLDLDRIEFVRLKIFSLMQKIFKDCYRFSTKLKDKDKELALFDTIVYKDAQFGLISLIAWMIATFDTKYLVYAHGVVREATPEEQAKIDEDYKSGMTYKYGIILDFKKYSIGKLLAHYFHQIYTIEQANNNSLALGGTVQYKVSDLRSKIGLTESMSDETRNQAKEVCRYAKDGKPIVIDAADSLEQTDAGKNVSVADSSRDRCYRELAAALGGPVSYITGQDEETTGSGYSYERLDGRAEDMIRNFWITVFEPIIKTLMQSKIDFVSQKWMTVKENLGSISMIETIDVIPNSVKASIIAKLLGDNKPDKGNELESEILKLIEDKEKAEAEALKNATAGTGFPEGE